MPLDERGLDLAVEFVGKLEGRHRTAAVRAANDSAKRARTVFRRRIREEIAFPPGYLERDDRLRIDFATRAKLEARVYARGRATSLARFVRGRPVRGQPVQVQVKPGSTRTIGRGFVINLRNNNRGLAIRLRPGEEVRGRRVKRIESGRLRGLALLYGPSVYQALLSEMNQGILPQEEDNLLRYFEREFDRQLAVLAR